MSSRGWPALGSRQAQNRAMASDRVQRSHSKRPRDVTVHPAVSACNQWRTPGQPWCSVWCGWSLRWWVGPPELSPCEAAIKTTTEYSVETRSKLWMDVKYDELLSMERRVFAGSNRAAQTGGENERRIDKIMQSINAHEPAPGNDGHRHINNYSEQWRTLAPSAVHIHAGAEKKSYKQGMRE